MLNWRGTSLSYNTRRATVFIVLMLLATFSIMLGCGVMPPGQASTRSFTVTGFTLPAAMVYSTEAAVRNQHPAIAASPDGAKAFVQRLVMQTVFSVLDSQGRSALLPDTIISAILEQLTVRISYEPLLCQKAVTVGGDIDQNKANCIIVDDTVTGTCTTAMARQMCMTGPNVMVSSVTKYTSISGTLSTTNIIMANWSKAMWQSVMNRAVRKLAAGPFRSHFFSAAATVGGN